MLAQYIRYKNLALFSLQNQFYKILFRLQILYLKKEKGWLFYGIIGLFIQLFIQIISAVLLNKLERHSFPMLPHPINNSSNSIQQNKSLGLNHFSFEISLLFYSILYYSLKN